MYVLSTVHVNLALMPLLIPAYYHTTPQEHLAQVLYIPVDFWAHVRGTYVPTYAPGSASSWEAPEADNNQPNERWQIIQRFRQLLAAGHCVFSCRVRRVTTLATFSCHLCWLPLFVGFRGGSSPAGPTVADGHRWGGLAYSGFSHCTQVPQQTSQLEERGTGTNRYKKITK